ncbi:MAG: hypothetical protein KIH67_004305 [Candidatus Moranbacteria bacterium]|nr:hypothetical protein [Candidatus Moranbacteria bacterium]
MSNRLLLILFFVLFITSSAFLFERSLNELDQEANKNWWTISFIRPDRVKNIDIVVSNYTEDTHFKYQILAGDTVIEEQGFEAPLGENRILLITPEKTPEVERVTVRVIHKDQQQELFRNYKLK